MRARERPALVFALSLAALEMLEAHFRRFSPDGLHFEGWTSELLMQSVSLRELAAAPFASLWHLHVQPPVCNLIRAFLAAIPPHATGTDLIRAVDGDLNHRDRLAIERGLMACFRRELSARSFSSLGAAYRDNLVLYFRPSSTYISNVVVDHLPWRQAYDRVFSGNRLLWAVLVAGALAFWQSRRRWRAALAVALPVAYVFLVSIAGEHGENQRFKFFLEPGAFVLLATQVHRLGARAVAFVSAVAPPARRSDRRESASSSPVTPAPSPSVIPSAGRST